MISPSHESLLSALIFAELMGYNRQRQILVSSTRAFGHQIHVPKEADKPVRVLFSEQDGRELADVAADIAASIIYILLEQENRHELRRREAAAHSSSRSGKRVRRVKFEDDKETDKRAEKRAKIKQLRKIASLTAQMLGEAQRAALEEEN